MSPALTAPPENTKCVSCEAALDSGALKCSKCSQFVHLFCSNYPRYALIRLATSGVQYCCIRCLKVEVTEEKYNDEFKEIDDLIEREKAIIIPNSQNSQEPVRTFSQLTGENNGNSPIVEANDDSRTQMVQNSENEPDADDPSHARKSRPVCKYFKTKSCKHGAKGTSCAFSHPQKCHKFLKFGENSARGCKKGSKCDRYHPKLCFASLNQGWCDRENCYFHHLKGAKRSPPAWSTEQQGFHSSTVNRFGPESNPNHQRKNHSFSRAWGTTLPNRPQETTIPSREESHDQPNFLEILHQIQQMQAQMVKILQKEDAPPPKSRGGCSNCYNTHQ